MLDRGCLCFAILAVRQPAPEWRAEEGEGEEEIMKVSHENRSRIRKLKVVLDRGNVAKFDEDRKNGGGFFFFFSSFPRVLITRMETKEGTIEVLDLLDIIVEI